MRRFYPRAGAPSSDRPKPSSPPLADVRLVGDGAGKIDAKEDPGASQGADGPLPSASTPSARRVDEIPAPYLLFATHTSRSSEYLLKIASQSSIRPVLVPGMAPPSLPRRVSSEAEPAPFVAVPLSRNELPVPVASVVRSPSSTRLSLYRETDGLEQPQEMANASAEDQIDALRSQLKEQRLWNARFEEKSAGIAKRVGRLELAGKADAAEDVILMALAETDPYAAGADTATHEDTCELEESIWDSALFLGRPDLEVGRVVTLWAVLVLLLNILLQTTIAVIVLLKMGDPTFVARVIEDLWYASEPGLASECHVARPCWVIIYTTGCGGRFARWLDRRSSVGFC